MQNLHLAENPERQVHKEVERIVRRTITAIEKNALLATPFPRRGLIGGDLPPTGKRERRVICALFLLILLPYGELELGGANSQNLIKHIISTLQTSVFFLFYSYMSSGLTMTRSVQRR
jgi:hypothetical protein